MSNELGRALDEIAGAAHDAVRPVEREQVRARVRRRRAGRTVAGAVGAATAVAVVAVGANALDGADVLRAAASPDASTRTTPDATTSPTAPADPACGTVLGLDLVESDRGEVYGQVLVGYPDGRRFIEDAQGGSLFFDVNPMTEMPGERAFQGEMTQRTYVVDADGLVVAVHEREAIPDATSTFDPEQGYFDMRVLDAVDCRDGSPLDGTYDVIVEKHSEDVNGFEEEQVDREVVQLAAIAVGPDAVTPARADVSILPVCGQRLPDEVLDGELQADLVADVDLAGGSVRGAGARAEVTVRPAPGAPALSGTVPQLLRAFLVDDDGHVVSEWDFERSYDSTSTFENGSFTSEIYTWFGCVRRDGEAEEAEPGDYELYVYDVLPAADADGNVWARTVVGGPYEVSYDEPW